MQFDNLSLDQDMLSLRKECQEKDETIKDLTSFLQLTNKAGSKVRPFFFLSKRPFVFSPYDMDKHVYVISITARNRA